MQTTGFADETIGRLYEGDRLCRALADARARTLALYSHLDLETIRFPLLPTVNPAVWELSHIAWFQEYWCLRYSAQHGEARKPSILPNADALFDSARVPHDSRWSLPYPPVRALLDYMRATYEASLEQLEKTPEARRYFFALALLHEDMHGEALLMTLQTLGLRQPPIDLPQPARGTAGRATDVEFPGGEFAMGTRKDEAGFVFDNEKWAHAVRVAPFRMADRPVSQGEFAAFIDDTGAAAPRYWRRESGSWHVRRFDRWLPIDAHAPMVHVCLDEARAYCDWAGRRLPTEAEWEYAACNGGTADRFPWGDDPGELCAAARGIAPSRSGLREMIGGVWEWTSTAFGPYPGFRADPYKEYSEPWFGDHYVLRGGCHLTRARLVHNRFRNFYLPGRADAFAGLRTCAV